MAGDVKRVAKRSPLLRSQALFLTSPMPLLFNSLRSSQHYGLADGIGEPYWKYVTHFLDNCDTESTFPTSTPPNYSCVKDAMSHAAIDSSAVETCMKDSGGTTTDGVNTLLQAEITAKDEKGVVVVPTVYVNTVAMRGGISAQTVFSTICSGFLDGTSPEVCNRCALCFDVTGCVQANGICGGSTGGGAGGLEKKEVSR